MNEHDIERALTREDVLAPSSGFRASVMEAVHHEASAPPPIPFPWRKGGLALVAGSVLALGAAITLLVAMPPAPQPPAADMVRTIDILVRQAIDAGVHWLPLAVALTLACLALSRRLAQS